jgi:PAS domain S-box-containing protein
LGDSSSQGPRDAANEGDKQATDSYEWHPDDVRMVLDVTSRAHMTLWAAAGAEENYAIKLWGPGAERIYGHSRDAALGQNYIDLFVDSVERERAVTDHAYLTETGEAYTWDWAAEDHHSDGSIRNMLTHCFRIRHPETGQWLLAEIGIEISQLDKANRQLRMVREEDLKRQGIDFARSIGLIGQAVSEMGGNGTLEGVMQAISDAAARSLSGVSQTQIWLHDGDAPVEHTTGADEPLPFDTDAALNHVTQVGETIFYDSTTTTGTGMQVRIPRRRGRVRSFAVLPLRGIRGQAPVGALAVAWRTTPPLTSTDHGRLETLAAFAGPLLSVARELERNRAESRRRHLAESTRTVFRSVLHTIGGQIYVLQGEQKELEKKAITDGTSAELEASIRRLGDRLAVLDESLNEMKERVSSPEDPVEPVNILEVVTAVTNALRVGHPTIDFALDIPADLSVYAVRGWVNHILENVIGNAVLILLEVDQGGSIAVSAMRRSDHIDVHIEDSGPGVDPEIVDTLFDENVTRRRGGTGQGLHIARDLAESSGGSVTLAGLSKELKGAHFRVRLPASSSL